MNIQLETNNQSSTIASAAGSLSDNVELKKYDKYEYQNLTTDYKFY